MSRVVIEVLVPDGVAIDKVIGWSAAMGTSVRCEIVRRAPHTETPLEDHPWYIPVMRYLRGNTHDAGVKEVLSRMLAEGLIREGQAYELTGKGMAAAKTVGSG